MEGLNKVESFAHNSHAQNILLIHSTAETLTF